MNAIASLTEALHTPARVTVTGLAQQGAVVCEAAKIDVIGDSSFMLGIVIHDRRGGKKFVAWERIVTIECLPKEEQQ